MYECRIQFELRPKRDSNDNEKFRRQKEKVDAHVAPILERLDVADVDEPYAKWYRLTQRTCRELTSLFTEVKTSSMMRLYHAKLEIGLDASHTENAEWFVVSPTTWLEIEGARDGLIEVRADRVKGRTPLRRYSDVVLASETFVTFVKEHQISGVEFLWARDRGKYAAPQWYCPIGTKFLGRGLDHPWFDPATRGDYQRSDSTIVQPTESQWIRGVNEFAASQLRKGIKTDPPALARLLGQLRRMDADYPIPIVSPLCMLRKFLPRTDFAYARTGQGHRTVRLCVNAKTRKKLIEGRLAKSGDFEPVVVEDRAPKGTAVFDSPDSALPSLFSPEELARAREAEARYLAQHQENPKPPMPVKPPEPKKLIPKLKRLLKKQEAEVAKGASAVRIEKAGEEIGLPIPKRWRELLSAVDGFVIDDCAALDGIAELRVASAEDLAEEHRSCREMISIGDPDLPPSYLGVASSDIGDCIFLDTAKLTSDGDCPVIYIDHETVETVASWPAIGLFLADALEPPEPE